MSEPENFLERWSRRKLARGEPAEPEQTSAPAPAERQDAEPAGETVTPVTETADKPFDPASLPSIDSITADTDVTGFLRPGVPPELTRAALRRAWTSDPAIRDFVGLVENGWDFNDPNAMPGFGPLDPSEVARLAGQLLGQLPDAVASETTKPPAVADGETKALAAEHRNPPSPDGEPSDVQRNTDIDAAQKEPRDS
ncbi:MAG TPA: DUF3306 domain-containing protein [Pseudolabrys sp.]|nr:DUF3306 domain-containing protein [Pseudolabrys sp.]